MLSTGTNCETCQQGAYQAVQWGRCTGENAFITQCGECQDRGTLREPQEHKAGCLTIYNEDRGSFLKLGLEYTEEPSRQARNGEGHSR